MNYLLLKLQKNYKVVLLITIGYLIFGSLIFYYSKKISNSLNKYLELPLYSPGQVIKIASDLNVQLYFNDQPGSHAITSVIKKAILSAQNSIDIAMYSFDSAILRDELYNAAKRGVKIRLAVSSNKSEQIKAVFINKPENISIIEIGNANSASLNNNFMHNKFAIFDRGATREKLITGSLNWTTLQELVDPSYVLDTTDDYIIEAYEKEFARFISTGGSINKFKDPTYHPWDSKIEYHNGEMNIWWSPGFKTNSIRQKILDLINSAQTNIDIIVWQMTDSKIAQALVQKAVAGIKVRIITDDFNIWQKNSTFIGLLKEKNKLNLFNLEIVDDVYRTVNFKDKIQPFLPSEFSSFINSYLHQHTLIIDRKIVLFGTNNWSNMGNSKNDENILITDIKTLVDAFIKSFNYHYTELRNELLNVQLQNGHLIFNNLNQSPADKIIIIAESNNENEAPFICMNYELIKNTDELNLLLDNKCYGYHLNVFLIKKNKILANNLIVN